MFDRDWGSASEFLGGAVIAARDVPRGGRWAELKLDLQPRLPPDAVGVAKNGKKNKHVVPASAPAALGTVTVRIAAADDMSWDVLSDTGAVTTRPALRALAPGKFGANKIRAYAAGYRVAHKNVSSKAGAARTLHPKLIRTCTCA